MQYVLVNRPRRSHNEDIFFLQKLYPLFEEGTLFMFMQYNEEESDDYREASEIEGKIMRELMRSENTLNDLHKTNQGLKKDLEKARGTFLPQIKRFIDPLIKLN